ncbi:MAG TPA: MerR family transcriptional regulator [Firmicutes bacterium]|nr:MerR family transcriptional regulator [Bacillota bacterium]
MELRNCIRCGKVFLYVSKRVCPACQKEMDEVFEKARLYVKQNPGATAREVAEALQVDEQLIDELIREGRFDVVTEALLLSCERCGKPIRRGRLCEECAAVLNKEIQGVLPKADPAAPSAPTSTPRSPSESRLYLADHIVSKDKNGE